MIRKQQLLTTREILGLFALFVLLLHPRATWAARGLRFFDDADKQPAAFHIGLDYLQDNSMRISTEGLWQKNGLGDLRAGLEYKSAPDFIPRFGYRPTTGLSTTTPNLSSPISDLAAGVRMRLFGKRVVYAVAPFHQGGPAHYISLTTRFK